MIMFDYGQTLISEQRFDGVAGNKAIIQLSKSNPYNVTGKQMQALAQELTKDIGRWTPDVRKSINIEVHNHKFQNYLYEYYGLEFDQTEEELEKIFWENAAPAKATEHISKLLDYLHGVGIRTAVISNISFSGKALEERIRNLIPNHHFEFILATSEYVFRKPHNRIFELALRKAKLMPGEVWYCGDNAYFDVEGATKAGITPVWYTGAIEPENRLIPEYSCRKIGDWNELIDCIKEVQRI
jgi:putative hydrolase of the HAD superfamily